MAAACRRSKKPGTTSSASPVSSPTPSSREMTDTRTTLKFQVERASFQPGSRQGEREDDTGHAQPREQVTGSRVKRPNAAHRQLHRQRAVAFGEIVGDSEDATPRIERARQPGRSGPNDRQAGFNRPERMHLKMNGLDLLPLVHRNDEKIGSALRRLADELGKVGVVANRSGDPAVARRYHRQAAVTDPHDARFPSGDRMALQVRHP